MDLLVRFISSFYEYTVDILPIFVLAVFVTSALQGFTSLSWLRVILKRGKTAPIYTALLGGLLPLCSCSMLPVTNLINSMAKGYAPFLSFLIVAPIVSPVTILLNYGYFGPAMATFRLLGAFFFALLFAYTADLFFKKSSALPLSFGSPRGTGWRSFGSYFKENFFGIGKYLLMGILIASAIKTLVPPELIKPISNSVFSYVLLSFMSVPIYVCSGEEVPIAKALRDVGFTSGGALTFMLGGTGICVPTILTTLKFLPKGLVLAYISFWLFFSIVIGFFTICF